MPRPSRLGWKGAAITSYTGWALRPRANPRLFSGRKVNRSALVRSAPNAPKLDSVVTSGTFEGLIVDTQDGFLYARHTGTGSNQSATMVISFLMPIGTCRFMPLYVRTRRSGAGISLRASIRLNGVKDAESTDIDVRPSGVDRWEEFILGFGSTYDDEEILLLEFISKVNNGGTHDIDRALGPIIETS